MLSLAACSPTPTPESVATDLGDVIADRLAAPLRLAAQGGGLGASDELAGAAEIVLEELPVPEGAARVTPGRWSQYYAAEDDAQVATVLVVVPADEDGDPFCVAVTVHSTGRVDARPVPGDPANRCEDAALIDLIDQ